LTLNISEMVRDTDSFNGILRTYARPRLQWHKASRSLSATAELLVWSVSLAHHSIRTQLLLKTS